LKGEIVKSYSLATEEEERSLPSLFEEIPRLKDIPFFKYQTLWALRNKGLIDAEKIEEAIAKGVYFA